MKNQPPQAPKNYSDWAFQRVKDPELKKNKRDLLSSPIQQVDLEKV